MNKETNSSSPPLALMIILCVITLAYLGTILYDGYMQDKRRADLEARCSGSTMAEVSEIGSKIKHETVKMRRRRVRGRDYTEYTYHIDYEVDGKTYHTTETDRDTMRFSEGEKIPLKYNRSDPAECYVKRIDDGKHFGDSLTASGVAVVVLVLVMLGWALKRGEVKKQNTSFTSFTNAANGTNTANSTNATNPAADTYAASVNGQSYEEWKRKKQQEAKEKINEAAEHSAEIDNDI